MRLRERNCRTGKPIQYTVTAMVTATIRKTTKFACTILSLAELQCMGVRCIIDKFETFSKLKFATPADVGRFPLLLCISFCGGWSRLFSISRSLTHCNVLRMLPISSTSAYLTILKIYNANAISISELYASANANSLMLGCLHGGILRRTMPIWKCDKKYYRSLLKCPIKSWTLVKANRRDQKQYRYRRRRRRRHWVLRRMARRAQVCMCVPFIFSLCVPCGIHISMSGLSFYWFSFLLYGLNSNEDVWVATCCVPFHVFLVTHDTRCG